MDYLVRSYAPGDAAALGQVFFRAIHEGAAARYTKTQRQAWAAQPPASRMWEDRLSQQVTLVAENGEGPLGFMSFDEASGYIDLAFVLPKAMGRGVATALYAVLETRARAAGVTRLFTEASLLAEPFFARQGFRLVRRQEVERAGVALQNALMDKTLTPSSAPA